MSTLRISYSIKNEDTILSSDWKPGNWPLPHEKDFHTGLNVCMELLPGGQAIAGLSSPLFKPLKSLYKPRKVRLIRKARTRIWLPLLSKFLSKYNDPMVPILRVLVEDMRKRLLAWEKDFDISN